MNNGANSLVTRMGRPGKECEIEFRGGQIKSLVRKSCRVALNYSSDLSNDVTSMVESLPFYFFCRLIFRVPSSERHIVVSLSLFFFFLNEELFGD